MLISRLRLITFDVTDTLLKFRLVPGQKYEEIGTMYGILCDKASLSSNFKIHWRKMNKEHPNFGLHSGLGWESWWKILVEGSFQDTLLTLKDKQLEAAAEHLIKAYKTSSCWEQCHGTSGLLSYIRSKGIPMGIVSNYDPRLNELLANMKLGHFFQFVLISYEAGFEKPDKRIFEGAMSKSKLKQLKPEECLHVGDKVLLDYEGAKKCGWNAALENLSKRGQVIKLTLTRSELLQWNFTQKLLIFDNVNKADLILEEGLLFKVLANLKANNRYQLIPEATLIKSSFVS